MDFFRPTAIFLYTLTIIIAIGCGAPIKQPAIPKSDQCATTDPHHVVFIVYQDEREVGLEVRSVFEEPGPMGVETVTISHLMRRYRSHEVELDRFEIRSDRYLTENGTLLRSSYVTVDDASTVVSLVGFNGVNWDRIVERRSTVLDPFLNFPETANLTGTELVGFGLNEYLRHLAEGVVENRPAEYYYLPIVADPLPIEFTLPRRASIVHEGKTVTGTWVGALRKGTRRTVVELFADDDGRILEERYPSLHQVRRRASGPFTWPSDHLDPYMGLFSNAYLGLPNAATRATYHIVSSSPMSEGTMDFLGEPENQTIQYIDERTIELKVVAGAPDGNRPPKDADVSSTTYINTGDPIIADALEYLKTGGKKGTLPTHRRQNAIPVVARSARIADKTDFWTNPDQVARLIGEYVHAILPDKQRTYAMSNAVISLQTGLGDCTEHSVLFAALMRTAGIPTRLISGMYLDHGGQWVFHMWNEYWSDTRWQAVDTALDPQIRPGALYIALGLGASTFQDHRSKVAFFLDRSFSGMAINLVAAGNNGEELYLAKPKRTVASGHDSTLFNASTLIGRGNYSKALSLVEEDFNPDTSPLSMQLLRSELQYLNHRYSDALKSVQELRKKTSLSLNVQFLTVLELKIHLAMKSTKKARETLDDLQQLFQDDEPASIFYQALFLFETGQEEQAIALLDNALLTYPDHFDLLTSYVNYVATTRMSVSKETEEKAMNRARRELFESHYGDIASIKAAAALHFRMGQMPQAASLVAHGLILSGQDEDLLALQEKIVPGCN